MAKKNVTIGEWTDALRSGKYKQGVGNLRNLDNTYCCLGVLCDLVDPEAWDDNEGGLDEIGTHVWNNYFETLPPEEINIQIPNLMWPELGDDVTQKNDYGQTFEQIADLIESEYDRDYVIRSS